MDQRPILTFNHHESYLCALAGLPAKFDVVTRRGGLDLSWIVRARSVPSNIRLKDFAEVKSDIRAGKYRVIVCHTIKNLFWLLPYQRRHLIFVAHIPLFRSTISQTLKGRVKRAIVRIWQALFKLEVIAVSEFKRASWNIEAEVAKFFPVPFAKELLTPEKPERVSGAYVGNRIQERGTELGWPTLQTLLAKGLPIQILGNNPSIPKAYIPHDFADFVSEFSKAHFYVYPVQASDGDGYNTASLEAMLLGLPIVAIANPTSPIVHGKNGLVARDAMEMEMHIRHLVDNPSLRLQLGQAARATVLREFSPKAFWDVWTKVIAAAERPL